MIRRDTDYGACTRKRSMRAESKTKIGRTIGSVRRQNGPVDTASSAVPSEPYMRQSCETRSGIAPQTELVCKIRDDVGGGNAVNRRNITTNVVGGEISSKVPMVRPG